MEYGMKQTITYDDYLRLCGLLKLAADHRHELELIDRTACALFGIATGSLVSDEVWAGSPHGDAEPLLAVLGITVEDKSCQSH
jgi:hypothetical protein